MDLTAFTHETVETQKEATALLGRIIDLASPEAVFGQPLDGEGFRVLTAVEVAGGMGFGFGAGGDVAQLSAEAQEALAVTADPDEPQEDDDEPPAVGIGGGGGGGTCARPVAVISLTAAGVRVEPIVDRTKVLVSFFAALSVGLLALARRR